MDKPKTATKRHWLAFAACVAIAGGLTATWQQTTRHAAAADEETPLAKAMEIIGEKWTLLIMGDGDHQLQLQEDPSAGPTQGF